MATPNNTNSKTLSHDELQQRLEASETLALQAGKFALELRQSDLNIQSKSRMDFVTEADTAVETLLRTEIQKHFPNDPILGEEGGLKGGATGKKPVIDDTTHLWILDPIDGTHNYLMGLDHWSVSVGFRAGNNPALGCVYAPDRDQWFSASTGGGATVNNAPLKSKRCTNEHALIGIGISNRVEFSEHLNLMKNLNASNIEFRRFGSAALSICDVAAGKLDGYFEVHLNSWDCAAAIVVAREAGILVEGFELQKSIIDGDRFFAAAPGFNWKPNY